MQPSSYPGDPGHPAQSTVVTFVVRAYCWLSDQVYLRFAWAFDLITGLLTGGRFPRWRRVARDYLPADHVLDLACGTGQLLREWPVDARGLVGVDLSPGMAEVFRRRSLSTRHPAVMVQASADRLPFKDRSFKAAVATFPTRFLSDPVVLREAARVLRTDGERSGRLVVVGLHLVARHTLLQSALTALYGARPSSLRARFARQVEAAGLTFRGVETRGGSIQPALYIATLPVARRHDAR